MFAILSNGLAAMLESVVKGSGLRDLIQTVLSVELVGVFKPDPAVYRLAVEHLGVTASEIVFLSSNSWDAVGATAFGLKVAWVNPGLPSAPSACRFNRKAKPRPWPNCPGCWRLERYK